MSGIEKVNTPKISIIIPWYEKKYNVEKSINSIIKQTLKEYEILIVCSVSIKNFYKEKKELFSSNPKISFIELHATRISDLCNYGIENADGEYIAFLDAGDFYNDQMLERLYDECNLFDLDYAKSDFGFCIDDEKNIYFEENVFRMATNDKYLYGATINPSNYPMLFNTDLNVCNGIYKRKFLVEKGIFFNKGKNYFYDDIDFITKLVINAEKVKYFHFTGHIHIRYIEKNIEYLMALPNEIKSMFMLLSSKLNSELSCAVLRCYIDNFIVVFQKICVGLHDKNLLLTIAHEFYENLDEWLAKLNGYYYERVKEKYEIHLESLQNDLESFYLLEKMFASIKRSYEQDLLKSVERYSKCIIVGAGQVGQSCYALLLNNDFDRVECFCDNSHDKVGKNMMGLKVFYLEEAKVMYDNVLYIIAVGSNSYWGLYKQLRSMGIPDCNICRAKISSSKLD